MWPWRLSLNNQLTSMGRKSMINHLLRVVQINLCKRFTESTPLPNLLSDFKLGSWKMRNRVRLQKMVRTKIKNIRVTKLKFLIWNRRPRTEIKSKDSLLQRLRNLPLQQVWRRKRRSIRMDLGYRWGIRARSSSHNSLVRILWRPCIRRPPWITSTFYFTNQSNHSLWERV